MCKKNSPTFVCLTCQRSYLEGPNMNALALTFWTRRVCALRTRTKTEQPINLNIFPVKGRENTVMMIAAGTTTAMTTCRFVMLRIQCSDSKPRPGFGTKTNNKSSKKKNNLNQVLRLQLMTKIKSFPNRLIKFVSFELNFGLTHPGKQGHCLS